MKKIHKYGLDGRDIQYIPMPEGAEIISCQLQDHTICLWAIVIPKNPFESRIIEVVGTGNPMTELNEGDKRRFIATVLAGDYVWHVFEIVKDEVAQRTSDLSAISMTLK